MPNDTYPRRDVQRRFRAVDNPRLFAFPTGNGGTALPEILAESTYTPLATMIPGQAPALLGNGIYGYRTAPDEKMVKLEFCSVTGAENETQVWEFGVYAMPYKTADIPNTPAWTGWKNMGTVNFTITLGQRTLASQVTDPFVNSQSFVSSTIAWGDTYAETTNDFNNSTAGFYQCFTLGYGATNKSGHVVFDLSFGTLLCGRLVTKAASSIQELVGMYTEIN